MQIDSRRKVLILLPVELAVVVSLDERSVTLEDAHHKINTISDIHVNILTRVWSSQPVVYQSAKVRLRERAFYLA